MLSTAVLSSSRQWTDGGRLCQSCHFLQAAAALRVALATSPLFAQTADDLEAIHPFELPQQGSRLLQDPIGYIGYWGAPPLEDLFGPHFLDPIYFTPTQ